MKKHLSKFSDERILVSVIIPTFNAAERLSLLLESLENQSSKNFEVIVVDDGSTDETREMVRHAAPRFSVPLRYYYLDNTDIFGAGIARNCGARQAKGNILAFLDQDCVADQDLIKNHIVHHKTRDVILGYYAGYGHEKKCYDFSKLRELVRHKKAIPAIAEFREPLFRKSSPDDSWKCFVSAHFSIKKAVFKKFYFDESFTRWGCEDVDLGYRLFRAGKKISFVRECVVYNSSQAPVSTRGKVLTLSESLMQMYKKYRTEDMKWYCLERFHHTPLNHRDSLQLIFKNNNFEIRKTQTKVAVGKDLCARVVLGRDFPDTATGIADMVPLIKGISFDVGMIKVFKDAEFLAVRNAFHGLIRVLRDRGVRIDFDDIRKQSFLAGKMLIGPQTLSLDHYNKCNFQCLFCSIHSPLLEKKKYVPRPLDLKIVTGILEQAYEMGVQRVRVSSDGEPLLSADTPLILKDIAQKGFELEMLTNGILLKERHLALLNEIHKDINFLVNFSAAKKMTYRKIHGGRPGDYDAALRSLAMLSRFKQMKRRRGEFVFISTTFIITKINWQELSEYVRLMKRMGVDHIYFKFAILYGKAEEILISKMDMTKLRKELLRAKLTALKLFVFTNIDEVLNNINDAGFRNKNDIKQHSLNLPTRNCYNGWFFGRINPNGHYYICCRETLPVGNVRENDLKEILFSRRMEDLLDEGASGISLKTRMWHKCNYCYHLATNKKAQEWRVQK